MITEKFLELPPTVEVEGVVFEFQLFINGTNDIRVGYVLSYANQDSRHYEVWQAHTSWVSPFTRTLQDHLFLIENIHTDDQLLAAISDCKSFLGELKEEGFLY